VAPGDRAAERPLALRQVPCAAREIEAPAQTVEDLAETERADAGGGELDRERQPAEPLADRPDRREPFVGQDEVGPVRPGALHEQRHASRRVQRRDGMAAFAGDTQELPARDEHVQLRGRPHEGRDGLRAGREELLQVVEHEERCSIVQVRAQDVSDRLLG
jgi:hypothetical protein